MGNKRIAVHNRGKIIQMLCTYPYMNTQEIKDELNEKTKHGTTPGELGNLLGKGDGVHLFEKCGTVKIYHLWRGFGNYPAFKWKLKADIRDEIYTKYVDYFYKRSRIEHARKGKWKPPFVGRMKIHPEHDRKHLYVWKIGDYLFGKLARNTVSKIRLRWVPTDVNERQSIHWFIKIEDSGCFKYLSAAIPFPDWDTQYRPWKDPKFKDEPWYLGDDVNE